MPAGAAAINVLPGSVTIREVGPRDGLQAEARVVPTEAKIKFIDALATTGVATIQATSVVRPEAVPQLIDAADVMSGITRVPGVTYSILVPNLRGAERARGLGADEWDLMLSVTDAHSRSNSNCGTWEALERLQPVIEMAHTNGASVVGGMATALGCPFEGRVPYDRVRAVAQAYHDLGLRRLLVADTVGLADPALVYSTMVRLGTHFPDVEFGLHLHDTRGMALANLMAGMHAGITHFDTSIGGLGGCPFAPGASGNVATEDAIHMLELMGIHTGVHLPSVLKLARDTLPDLVGHASNSAVATAGVSWDLHVAPTHQHLPGSPPAASHKAPSEGVHNPDHQTR